MSQDQPVEQTVPPGGGLPRLSKAVALTTLVVLTVTYVLNAMDRQVFPVLVPQIRSDLGFSLEVGGLLATIFTLGIGVAGLPTGYLLDRLSRRSVMALGILIFSAFTVLTAVATGFGDMLVYRTLSGVGEAMQNAALFSAVGAYFFSTRALALGSLNFAYGVGSFLGPALGAVFAGSFGAWEAPFWIYGLLGLVLTAVVWVGVSRRFTEQVERTTPSGAATFAHVPAKLYNRNLLLLALTAGVVGVTMYGYIGLYPTFLQEQLGFSSGNAAFAASMFGIGALMGLPAGWLGDRFNQRTIMIASLVVGAIVGFLLFNGPSGYAAQLVLSFAEGAVASGFLFVNIYSSMQRAVRPTMLGRASGLYVASFYVPAALAGYLFSGLVVGAGWGGAAFWQLTILPLLGIVALLFVDTRQFSNARQPAPTSQERTA